MSGAASTRIVTTAERGRLARDWRIRADRLDAAAGLARCDGDPRHAEELERAAVEYRAAADELELGSVPDSRVLASRAGQVA